MVTREDFESKTLAAIDQAFANQWWVNLNEDTVERIRDNMFDVWHELFDTPPNSETAESCQLPTTAQAGTASPICPMCKSDKVIYAFKLGVYQCDNCGEAWAGKLPA